MTVVKITCLKEEYCLNIAFNQYLGEKLQQSIYLHTYIFLFIFFLILKGFKSVVSWKKSTYLKVVSSLIEILISLYCCNSWSMFIWFVLWCFLRLRKMPGSISLLIFFFHFIFSWLWLVVVCLFGDFKGSH